MPDGSPLTTVADTPAQFVGLTPARRARVELLDTLRPLAGGGWITDGVDVPDAATLTSLIGDTPLVDVEMLVDGEPRELWLKLEGVNPGGSIKDRTALSLLEAA